MEKWNQFLTRKLNCTNKTLPVVKSASNYWIYFGKQPLAHFRLREKKKDKGFCFQIFCSGHKAAPSRFVSFVNLTKSENVLTRVSEAWCFEMPFKTLRQKACIRKYFFTGTAVLKCICIVLQTLARWFFLSSLFIEGDAL